MIAKPRRIRVLVIDDDKHFLTTMRQMLQHSGFDVLAVSSGREAVEMYYRDPADVVVTDLVMPEYDGMETIIDLIEPFPNAKIIAISGGPLGNPDWLPSAKILGALHTLEKPFSMSSLIKLIREVVADKAQEA